MSVIILTELSTTPPGNCLDDESRLANPIDNEINGTREGRVEICINNVWGTVCNTAFNNPDALVACQQLVGFKSEGELALHNSALITMLLVIYNIRESSQTELLRS